MKKNCTVSVFHDTRYAKSGDRLKKENYPVKIRATFKMNEEGKSKWIQKYFPTGHDLTEKEFESVMSSPRTSELKEIRQEILDLQAKALKIVKDNNYLTPESFASQYAGTGNLNNVIDFMKMMKKQCFEQGRIGTSYGYRDAIGSISDFVNPTRKRAKKQDDEPSVHLMFVEVDEEWLKRYELWAKKKGLSINTIGMYLRNLRAAFNLAMSKKYRIISADIYPFGRHGHVIKMLTKTKWAPEEEEKQNLFSYQTDDLVLQRALDFGRFSYYMNGSNPADIAHLKASAFLDEYIELDRRKTSNTEINKKLIKIYIHQEMREIYRRWGNKTLNPDDYAFPILVPGLTPQQHKERIKDFIQEVNAGLDVIGKEVGLKKKLTFGIFRHIYSTTLDELGVDTKKIQRGLGHESEKTTDNYLHGQREKKIAKELSGLL